MRINNYDKSMFMKWKLFFLEKVAIPKDKIAKDTTAEAKKDLQRGVHPSFLSSIMSGSSL